MAETLGRAVLRGDYNEPRVPVMEHPGGLSRTAIRYFSGIDPLEEPGRINEAFRKVAEAFEIDLLWGGGLPMGGEETFDWDDGESRKTTRGGRPCVQWGIFATGLVEGGRHFLHVPQPRSVDEALDFRPLDHFPATVDEYEAEFSRAYARMLASTGCSCYPVPHHYTTAFHWPLAIFGFELLCEAGTEEARFGSLMERFAEVSLRITTAWARVEGLASFILHDDLTMSSGPIFRPAWYRRHIFRHYPAIFAPLKAAGIPIIFTSDGACTAFIDDIFAAGADGLNFEYLVDLKRLVVDYPDRILIGIINSATIAQGPPERIDREVAECIETGSRARRFVVNIGGGLTHDMPVHHLEHYLEIRKKLCRTARTP